VVGLLRRGVVKEPVASDAIAGRPRVKRPAGGQGFLDLLGLGRWFLLGAHASCHAKDGSLAVLSGQDNSTPVRRPP